MTRNRSNGEHSNTSDPHILEDTFPVSVGARALRKSVRWYTEQLKTGRFPGHQAGRTWFLTASDIRVAIEICRPSNKSAKPQATKAGRPPSSRPLKEL